MTDTDTGFIYSDDGTFEPAPDFALELRADGHFVHYNEVNGSYSATTRAILPPKVEADSEEIAGNPLVVTTKEEDISNRLPNAKKATYLLQLGIKYDTDEMISMFCFDGAIVEYRKNIGIPSDRKSAITGINPCYMKTYASVGIPRERFKWLVEGLKNVGIKVVAGERDVYTSSHVWITANITRNYTPPVIIRTPDSVITRADANLNLCRALELAESNIIGVVGMEITLKRSKDFSINKSYRVTPSLKGMQILDITDLSSPPLNKVVEFEASSSITSERLLQKLRGPPGSAFAKRDKEYLK